MDVVDASCKRFFHYESSRLPQLWDGAEGRNMTAFCKIEGFLIRRTQMCLCCDKKPGTFTLLSSFCSAESWAAYFRDDRKDTIRWEPITLFAAVAFLRRILLALDCGSGCGAGKLHEDNTSFRAAVQIEHFIGSSKSSPASIPFRNGTSFAQVYGKVPSNFHSSAPLFSCVVPSQFKQRKIYSNVQALHFIVSRKWRNFWTDTYGDGKYDPITVKGHE